MSTLPILFAGQPIFGPTATATLSQATPPTVTVSGSLVGSTSEAVGDSVAVLQSFAGLRSSLVLPPGETFPAGQTGADESFFNNSTDLSIGSVTGSGPFTATFSVTIHAHAIGNAPYPSTTPVQGTIPGGTLVGNPSDSFGFPTPIVIGENLSFDENGVLNASGTGGGGGTVTLAGAVTGEGTGTVQTTFGQIAATTLLGNATGAPAAATAIPLGSGLSIVSGALTAASGALSSVASLDVLSNITGAPAVPTGNPMSSIFDAVFGATVDGILTRGASVWNLVSNLILPSTGPQRFLSGPFINVTGPGTAVANTTTPTSLFTGATFRGGQSLTIPANSLLAGDEIEMSLWGVFSIASTTVQLQISVLVGGNVVAQSEATSPTAAVTNGEWHLATPIKLWFPQVGASGTCAAHGIWQGVVSAPGNSIMAVQIFNGSDGGGSPALGAGLLTAINTTAALALDVRAQWNTASASDSLQLLGGTIKKSG
jgi:hypothetical protein